MSRSPLSPNVPLSGDYIAMKERHRALRESVEANADGFENALIAWAATYFGGDLGAIFSMLAKKRGVTPDPIALEDILG